jgi:hypothetical protein
MPGSSVKPTLGEVHLRLFATRGLEVRIPMKSTSNPD